MKPFLSYLKQKTKQRTVSAILILFSATFTLCSFKPVKTADHTIPILKNETPTSKSNKQSISKRSIEVVKKSKGVFVYSYKEQLDPFNYKEEFQSVREIKDQEAVQKLETLLTESREYQPEYRVRCLPIYEYGLEFRMDKTTSRYFLFSPRCNTVQFADEKLFRDFTPVRGELFRLMGIK